MLEIVKRLNANATIRQAHPLLLPLKKSLSSYERRTGTGRRVWYSWRRADIDVSKRTTEQFAAARCT